MIVENDHYMIASNILNEYNYRSTKHKQKNQNNLEISISSKGRRELIKIIFQNLWPTTSEEKDQKKTLLLLILNYNHQRFPYNSQLRILAVKDVHQYLHTFF